MVEERYRETPGSLGRETMKGCAMQLLDSHQLTCDICGSAMVEQKCKIRCLNCGYTRDCSDP